MEFVDLGLECWTTVPITLSIPGAVLAGVDKSYGVSSWRPQIREAGLAIFDISEHS